jgi:hypothetical protein
MIISLWNLGKASVPSKMVFWVVDLMPRSQASFRYATIVLWLFTGDCLLTVVLEIGHRWKALLSRKYHVLRRQTSQGPSAKLDLRFAGRTPRGAWNHLEIPVLEAAISICSCSIWVHVPQRISYPRPAHYSTRYFFLEMGTVGTRYIALRPLSYFYLKSSVVMDQSESSQSDIFESFGVNLGYGLADSQD